MSLFDVIKYPISTPPTTEELEALPKPIYIKWVNEYLWWIDGTNNRAWIAINLAANINGELSISSNAESTNNIVKALKKMIEEWEE